MSRPARVGATTIQLQEWRSTRVPRAVEETGPWIPVKDGDPIGRALFSRHYTYNVRRDQMSFFPAKNRNYGLFVGPGQKMVLLTPDERALFVWRKFRSMDWQLGVNCAVFRNEGSASGRASDLIRAADVLAWERWPGERHYTYVDAKKTRRKRDPGRCFRKAGYRPCGTTKGGLLILERFQLLLPPPTSTEATR